SHGQAVDQHGARTALAFAAAELAAGEIELVPEDRKEAVFRRALDLVGDAIDAQGELRHTSILRPAPLTYAHRRITGRRPGFGPGVTPGLKARPPASRRRRPASCESTSR